MNDQHAYAILMNSPDYKRTITVQIYKGESITDVIGEFVSLKSKMEAIGKVLSERELSLCQLSKLLSSWGSFIATRTSKYSIPTFKCLVTLILHKERKSLKIGGNEGVFASKTKDKKNKYPPEVSSM